MTKHEEQLAREEADSPSKTSDDKQSSSPAKSIVIPVASANSVLADAADVDRPKRKKARRACAACQRAHLTCADERPCMRCIKRGLAHKCHDGTRKKAKYLFDTPDDLVDATKPTHQEGVPLNVPLNVVDSAARQPAPTQTQINTNVGSTAASASPAGALQYQPLSAGVSALPAASYPLPQPQQSESAPVSAAGSLGPIDTSLYDINVADLNFDNYFGALEFGILDHLALGAVGIAEDGLPLSPSDASITPTTFYSPITSQPQWQYQQPQPQAPSLQLAGTTRTQSSRSMTMTHALDDSLADASTPRNVQSSKTAVRSAGLNSSSSVSASTFDEGGSTDMPPPRQSTSSLPINRDPSHIYNSVTTPYSYTAGFHALTALLQRRFTPQRTLRIAKALASIRPSFIACTKDLKSDDLTFMEKCFQRTLLQYDDFINAYGCPTIICRRTGEVAAASKEFTQLTGWQGGVLLGTEPNLNINCGSNEDDTGAQLPLGSKTAKSTSTTDTSSSSPSKRQNVKSSSGKGAADRVQPVFLAELLDQDSMVHFYEDFAELAFGDPRGHVVRPCKLLRYQTEGKNEVTTVAGSAATATKRASGIDCMYCWSIKRDVFDIPMLIVINFLPRF